MELVAPNPIVVEEYLALLEIVHNLAAHYNFPQTGPYMTIDPMTDVLFKRVQVLQERGLR